MRLSAKKEIYVTCVAFMITVKNIQKISNYNANSTAHKRATDQPNALDISSRGDFIFGFDHTCERCQTKHECVRLKLNVSIWPKKWHL